MKRYFSYKQEIDKCTLIDLLDELEYQAKEKTIARFVSKNEKKVEECNQKIFLLKMRMLEINEVVN
ncbi:hypothetical protein [Paraclostridium bifermentans]|uniref:hypothetical protein n=1 Tax=Paraclostridium bifermentans TaxID=1490 RepID=UPI0018A00858|nr:hypothetical protein [Paraclostridium bifermentans]